MRLAVGRNLWRMTGGGTTSGLPSEPAFEERSGIESGV